MDQCKAAVVHDPAIPVSIDIAGLNVGGIVDPQRKRRYDNAKGRKRLPMRSFRKNRKSRQG